MPRKGSYFSMHKRKKQYDEAGNVGHGLHDEIIKNPPKKSKLKKKEKAKGLKPMSKRGR